MKQVAPLRNWRAANNCYLSDTLFREPHYNWAKADQLSGKLESLWLRTAKRAPVAVAKARLCRASIAWDPIDLPKNAAVIGTVLTVPANLYGFDTRIPADVARNLQTRPLSPRLADFLHSVRVKSSSGPARTVLWRGALWSYVAYLCLFVAARRLHRWQILAVGVVCLANQLMVIAANPAQLYRYMVGPIFIGVLLVPIAWARRAATPRVDEQDADDVRG